MRGINVYKRNYTLDLHNLVIRFSHHHEKKLICVVAGDYKNVVIYFLLFICLFLEFKAKG